MLRELTSYNFDFKVNKIKQGSYPEILQYIKSSSTWKAKWLSWNTVYYSKSFGLLSASFLDIILVSDLIQKPAPVHHWKSFSCPGLASEKLPCSLRCLLTSILNLLPTEVMSADDWEDRLVALLGNHLHSLLQVVWVKAWRRSLDVTDDVHLCRWKPDTVQQQSS